MRPPSIRDTQLWLVGCSLAASLLCLIVALFLGLAARTDATNQASTRMAFQADSLARQIDADLTLFDLALRETSHLPAPRESPARESPSRAPLLELPLIAQYISFIDVLNEVGDVVADSRTATSWPAVSRAANFAGRDYFQDHLKNPADIVMVGRPFGTAPTQHAAIPISRRLTSPDGGFAGVVVAGVRLTWLSDILSHAPPGVTIRRDDGLILMRSPFDADAIGRGGASDPAWQDYLRTGRSPATDDTGGPHLFRRVGASPLVLELRPERSEIDAWERLLPFLLPLLAFIPGLGVLGLSVLTGRLRLRGRQIEAAVRAANDDRMRLLATMSHELRSPLTGILGQAELMAEEGGLSDRQTIRLTRLTEAGALMRTIVDRVTDIAQPDDHDAALALAACDLDQLVRASVGIVESEARKKGLRVTTLIDPATPAQPRLERDLVQQVLVNLLMNAVKFTTQGTVALRVLWNAAGLRFEIVDTGPGIPEGKRRRLFREYDRLDPPGSSNAEGTGLGLSITERFVHRMGGRIGHEDNPGGGSVFWFELPVFEPETPNPETHSRETVRKPLGRPRHDPRRGEQSLEAHIEPPRERPLGAARELGVEATREARLAASDEPSRDTHTLRILLADDLDVTRSVTAEFLRLAGHTVTEVPDGTAAIDAARTTDFDVILTDMRMPIMDGLEATRRIRALRGHRGRTPVVLVTADLAALGKGASGQAGVDRCLMKPFTNAELLTAVEQASRLGGTPRDGSRDDQVLNKTVLSELRGRLDRTVFAANIQAAVHRIENLIMLLERLDAEESPVVASAVHDLVGIASLMGLTELSSCLRWFDIAPDRSATIASLREAAAEAIHALRHHQGAAAAWAAPDAGQRTQGHAVASGRVRDHEEL